MKNTRIAFNFYIVALLAVVTGGSGQVVAATAPSVAAPSVVPDLASSERWAKNVEGKIIVTPDNFIRAESDIYMAGQVKDGAFGQLKHTRSPAPVDKQLIVRLNRDTIYSSGVFDLDAGPVTINLPDPG